ncbi:MAG: hypothetical protein L6301_03245 [Desulfobacteraceae bacterium]|nr:hypothetical protein [Desulfobacteraceae bacterium]
MIVVKTYPEISRKYTETVCTAGILAETKQLVRLYPIRFRYLEGSQQFKKYQWIKARISKPNQDSRPESYTIFPDSIEMGEVVPATRNWEERCSWVINPNTVFSSMEALRAAQKDTGKSLGVVKPDKIKRIFFQNRNEADIKEAITKKNSVINQLDLFETKKDLYIMPIRIMIEFFCKNPDCSGHKMSILDWEFMQLFRKLEKDPNWKEKIKEKIMGQIFDKTRDTHLILGNMAGHPQTFCVLGFFWPPYQKVTRQMSLFD